MTGVPLDILGSRERKRDELGMRWVYPGMSVGPQLIWSHDLCAQLASFLHDGIGVWS